MSSNIEAATILGPKDVWRTAAFWRDEGRPIALATVIDTWGSSPVAVGGQMIIASENEFQGSVSGGCVEAEVIASALDVIADGKPKRLSFGVADETAWAVGLPCGGMIEVFIEPLIGATANNFLRKLIAARDERRAILVETDLQTGDKVVHEDGPTMPTHLRDVFKAGRSKILPTPSNDIFVQSQIPQPRMIIIGATHIAQATIAIAGIIGLSCTLIDPRDAFASKSRFGDTPIVHAWPQDALPGLGLDEFTAIIALAHVAHIDDEALKLGLASKSRYVGALGSTRNHAKRRIRLAQAGVAESDIERIHCPIGLDIGALTPEEIALSLVSEVVLSFRGPKRTKNPTT